MRRYVGRPIFCVTLHPEDQEAGGISRKVPFRFTTKFLSLDRNYYSVVDQVVAINRCKYTGCSLSFGPK